MSQSQSPDKIGNYVSSQLFLFAYCLTAQQSLMLQNFYCLGFKYAFIDLEILFRSPAHEQTSKCFSWTPCHAVDEQKTEQKPLSDLFFFTYLAT